MPQSGRRSIRLKDFDYSQVGAYFVTICTYDRECLFGQIVDEKMRSNEFGRLVAEEWSRSGKIRHEMDMDEFIVMPNHVHGIIKIMGSEKGVGNQRHVGATGRSPLPAGPAPNSIGAFVAGFKSIATKRINDMRGTPRVPIWQRNYYEHVIRDEKSLNRIREYILTNPERWESDKENPLKYADDEFDLWLMSFKARPDGP